MLRSPALIWMMPKGWRGLSSESLPHEYRGVPDAGPRYNQIVLFWLDCQENPCIFPRPLLLSALPQIHIRVRSIFPDVSGDYSLLSCVYKFPSPLPLSPGGRGSKGEGALSLGGRS